MKHFLHSAVVAIAVSGSAVALSSWTAPMVAQSTPTVASQKVNFKPPDVTAPDNRQAGTHRGKGCSPNLSMMSLIPPSNRAVTVAESPTFFAYVSQAKTAVEFVLQAEDGTEVYKTAFKVDKPGIVEVRVPAVGNSKKSLEVGKRYQWSLTVMCADPDDRSGDYYVKSFVERIEPGEALKKELANPDSMARAIAYAKHEIWYDTISTLAQMRRKAPEDKALTAEWQQLLKSQRLESIATQPLVQSF
ncbi:MAG: DUF928 domain-containing protein [Microcoleus sp.]